MIAVINIPLYLGHLFPCIEESDIKSELQDNLDFYCNGLSKEQYTEKYGDEITQLIETLLTVEFSEVSEIQSQAILVCCESSDFATVQLPMRQPQNRKDLINADELSTLSFFELMGNNYVLCNYGVFDSEYSLYTYSQPEAISDMLNSGVIAENKNDSLNHNIISKKVFSIPFICALILIAIMTIIFLPVLILNKTSTQQDIKIGKYAAVCGCIVIPLIYLVGFVILY